MLQRRPRSIEVDGVNHGSVPIPLGSRVGNMIFSSGIPGKDPSAAGLPADAATQARFAFENMKSLLTNGGATLADVAHVTVFIKDNSLRDHVNAEWIKCFPDPKDRPARHTLMWDLQHGMLLQLEIVAVVQDR